MPDKKPDRELTDAEKKVKENEKTRQRLRAAWKAKQRAEKAASEAKKAEEANRPIVFYPPPEQPEEPEWDPDRFLDLPEPPKVVVKAKRILVSKPIPITPRRQRIIDFLVQNPEFSTAELMVKFACGEKTIQRARAQAIEQGKVNPSFFDRKSKAGREAREKGTGAEPIEKTVRRLLDSQDSETIGPESELTLAQSLSMLSKLAKGAEAEGQKKLAIDAVNAYHKLKSASIATKVGPGVPLTHEEKVERAARVLEAAGEQAARAAFLVAFAREAPRVSEVQSPEIRHELAEPQLVETEM